ncbi:MAG: hypothetical protein JJU00_13760 [Opitutales bacterium]|nr:hypothetical protein [Opitutales bacterium]
MKSVRARIFPVVSVVVVVLATSGCATADRGSQNAFGLIQSRPAHFAPPKDTTFAVSTKELVLREDPTGRETRLFWGLITITDY